ncbi:MAG: hypothetical protein ACREF4_04045 [Gammaproteobacteria bacterium]
MMRIENLAIPHDGNRPWGSGEGTISALSAAHQGHADAKPAGSLTGAIRRGSFQGRRESPESIGAEFRALDLRALAELTLVVSEADKQLDRHPVRARANRKPRFPATPVAGAIIDALIEFSYRAGICEEQEPAQPYHGEDQHGHQQRSRAHVQ